MAEPAFRIVTHGGAGSPEGWTDGTEAGARAGLEALQGGQELLDAVEAAVAVMENDERFNAGTGSNLRADGRTVQMDAAIGDGQGRFGAVACIEDVPHPISAARQVIGTEHRVLAGQGAKAFAREVGVPTGEVVGRDRLAGDTVGAVATDGDGFAAALSSGGTRGARVGRVGDVPLPGCGLQVGPAGAIAATGHGESIAHARAADRAYRLLEEGRQAQAVVDAVRSWFPEETSIGVIVLGPDGHAGGSNRSMASSALSDRP